MGFVFINVVALQVKTHLAVYSSGELCLDYGGTLITVQDFQYIAFVEWLGLQGSPGDDLVWSPISLVWVLFQEIVGKTVFSMCSISIQIKPQHPYKDTTIGFCLWPMRLLKWFRQQSWAQDDLNLMIKESHSRKILITFLIWDSKIYHHVILTLVFCCPERRGRYKYCAGVHLRTTRGGFRPWFQHSGEGEAGKLHRQQTLPASHWQWAQNNSIRLGKVSKQQNLKC